MTRTISERELQHDAHEILVALERGEDFLVTRNGVPIGELRPARRHFVSREVLLEAVRLAPASDRARFREDVDAPIDQDIEPRA